MMKRNSLTIKIWHYLIFFCLLILAFLWFFQVVFINSYYKWTKTRDIKQIANNLLKQESNKSIYESLNEVSYQENLCIEITNETTSIFTSSAGRSCLFDKSVYINEFINSNKNEMTYEFQNERFKDESILYALKLDNNLYAFISTSIKPLDSTINILKEQLIIVSIVVLLLSFIIAYFISKHLSRPIVKISHDASKVSKGLINTNFSSESDILELVELNDALNKMIEEISKTEELQKDLMANISHDLKTPLTMIKAYAEMIRDITYKNDEKRIANTKVIIEEVDRLTLLVNDILELSKIEGNITTLDLSSFDLITLIKDILKRFKIYEENEGYKFIFTHHNIKTLKIKADKKKLEQVLYNLIINALNYTGSDKKITVLISLENNSYKVSVTDSGKGIKDSDLPHIFDKYYKDKKKHQRNKFGTGLGLTIVKNIFILHNYQYGVISKKDKGSTFYFIIPKEN